MNDLTKRKIGERINSALADANCKQKDLAKALGVTDNTVSYWCSGARTPNTEQIIEIAMKLGVSSDYLLGLSDVMTNDTDVKMICDYTGLTEEAVSFLVLTNKCLSGAKSSIFSDEANKVSVLISKFITDSSFAHIIANMKEAQHYFSCALTLSKEIVNALRNSQVTNALINSYYDNESSVEDIHSALGEEKYNDLKTAIERSLNASYDEVFYKKNCTILEVACEVKNTLFDKYEMNAYSIIKAMQRMIDTKLITEKEYEEYNKNEKIIDSYFSD